MKAYIYSPAEAGFDDWSSGTLRLDGVQQVEDPAEANIFVCPGNLSMFRDNGQLNRDKLYRLPYLRGNEHRSVFFDVSDNFTTSLGLPLVFIRCDVRRWMLADDPNTIQVAWPVEDYAECVDLPETGFKFDVSFQGWLSSETRVIASRACREHPELIVDIAEYKDFCGYIYYEPEGIRRRAEFRRSMRESRLCLCPESIPGVLPYRFFEAMSAGRVPILVGSDFVLPFSDEIPYDNFILRIERDAASDAGETARTFCKLYSDEYIIEQGRLARSYWLKYLNCDDWPRTMAKAVEQKVMVHR